LKHFYDALNAPFVGLNPHPDGRTAWNGIIPTLFENIEVQESIAQVAVKFDEAKPLCGIEPADPSCCG
jgi:hypothetical protein